MQRRRRQLRQALDITKAWLDSRNADIVTKATFFH
jgi:hypothetical protein